MNELFSLHAGFGWAALIVLLAVAAACPVQDQPPQCWCEAFGVKREDCYCVSFEERAE